MHIILFIFVTRAVPLFISLLPYIFFFYYYHSPSLTLPIFLDVKSPFFFHFFFFLTPAPPILSMPFSQRKVLVYSAIVALASFSVGKAFYPAQVGGLSKFGTFSGSSSSSRSPSMGSSGLSASIDGMTTTE